MGMAPMWFTAFPEAWQDWHYKLAALGCSRVSCLLAQLFLEFSQTLPGFWAQLLPAGALSHLLFFAWKVSGTYITRRDMQMLLWLYTEDCWLWQNPSQTLYSCAVSQSPAACPFGAWQCCPPPLMATTAAGPLHEPHASLQEGFCCRAVSSDCLGVPLMLYPPSNCCVWVSALSPLIITGCAPWPTCFVSGTGEWASPLFKVPI